MQKQNRKRLAVIFALNFSLLGCPAEVPQSSVPQPEAVVIPVVLEIAPGARPKTINGTPLITVDQFFKPPEGQKPWALGDWLIIEGKVMRSSELFGATLVSLSDANGSMTVQFEAMRPRLEGNSVGKNVVVRGRLTSQSNWFAEGAFVTQEQITEALKPAVLDTSADSK